MKIIKVPFVNALGKIGPEEAPDAIIKELKDSIENFESLDVQKIEIKNNNVEKSSSEIYEFSKNIFKSRERPIFIGGDHSLSYSSVKAFKENANHPFLIIFDAHADCDNCTKEPTHEEWLRGIIESGFDTKNVVLIGIRKIWNNEKQFLIKNGIKVFNEIENLEVVADYITERANGCDVYVSIDIDAIDPAFAPAVNYPEPAGITSKDYFYLIKRIFRIPTLRAIDIVEVVPKLDKKYDLRTIKLAVKTIEEFLQRALGMGALAGW